MRYLSFDDACVAVAQARDEAITIVDRPRRAPPTPLGDCDRRVIESALAAPAMELIGLGAAYPTIEAKAAVMLYGLAKSQACRDGNKRIALILVVEFLSLNGAELRASNDEVVATILKVASSDAAARDLVIMDLTTWFERWLGPCQKEEM